MRYRVTHRSAAAQPGLTQVLGLLIKMSIDLTAEKLTIALVGAVAGWLLAQITTSIRAYADRRRAKLLLLEELKDVKIQTARLLTFYGRQLQIYGSEGVGASSSVGIANPIYENYYKTALLSLNQDQRLSFQMIHSIVNHANRQLDQFEQLTESLQKDFAENGATTAFSVGGKRWGEAAKAAYLTVGSLQWHVIHHLRSPKLPSLSVGGEIHRTYLQFCESLREEADRTIESGKSIDREKFSKIYDPDNFATQP